MAQTINLWGPALLVCFTVLVGVIYQNNRINDLSMLINKRHDDLRDSLGKRIDDLAASLGKRIDALESPIVRR